MLWSWGGGSASKVLAPHEFYLQHPHKPLVVAVCICNPSQGEVETGCCRDIVLASCLVELVSSRSPIGKKKKKEEEEERKRREGRREVGRGGMEGRKERKIALLSLTYRLVFMEHQCSISFIPQPLKTLLCRSPNS